MEAEAVLKEKVEKKQDIEYVFMFHGYTILVMKNGVNEVVDLPITAMEELLKTCSFYRIHRSYLVNLKRINELEIKNNKLLIRIRGHELPVSRRRKKQLLETLGAIN